MLPMVRSSEPAMASHSASCWEAREGESLDAYVATHPQGEEATHRARLEDGAGCGKSAVGVVLGSDDARLVLRERCTSSSGLSVLVITPHACDVSTSESSRVVQSRNPRADQRSARGGRQAGHMQSGRVGSNN